MAIVEAALVIHAPREVVYSLSQDYSVRSAWDKFTTHMEMADGSPYLARPGSRVHVRARFGASMTVEFIQIDPPERAAIRMVSGPSILENFAGTWIFEKIDEKTTLTRFLYSISVRQGPLHGPMQWLAERYFGKVTLRRLEGLKRYSEHVAKLRNMPAPLRNFTF